MTQVIITGASGLLGSELVGKFREKNHDVLAIFNQNPDRINLDVDKVQCDISSRRSVMALGNKIKPTALIIHCAAITDVDKCEKEKSLCRAVNIRGTKNVCDLASKMGSQLIYISTASVFDGKKGNYSESDKTNPTNYYNFSKIEGERYTLGYKRGVVIRTTPLGLHPASRKPASFLEWLVSSFKNNLNVNLFTDVKINPLSASTVAQLITSVPSLMRKGVIHLGSQDVVSKADVGLGVVKFFPEYAGKLGLIGMDDNKQNLTNRPKEMWLNVDKATALGLDLSEALSDLNQYLNEKKLL
jgi:dTDP-4-dehydrorhamnose reductase